VAQGLLVKAILAATILLLPRIRLAVAAAHRRLEPPVLELHQALVAREQHLASLDRQLLTLAAAVVAEIALPIQAALAVVVAAGRAALLAQELPEQQILVVAVAAHQIRLLTLAALAALAL
jgi:hypothetical protein